MKKKISMLITGILLASATCVSVFAADDITTRDVQIGSQSEIEMVGKVEPTILSVTMPSFIPFNISNNVQDENKVVSPRIKVQNNSAIPIRIEVYGTDVNLSKMQGVSWSDSVFVSGGATIVDNNSVAVGFKEEEEANVVPTSLENSKWLQQGYYYPNINLMELQSNQSKAMYVVGALGKSVVNDSTFTVVPHFIVISDY